MQTAGLNLTRWCAAALVVCGFLILDFATPVVLDRGIGGPWLSLSITGAWVGQLYLIAAWAVLGVGNVLLRLPGAMLTAALMWYSLVLGSRAQSPYFSLPDALAAGFLLLLALAFLMVSLWVVRGVLRWRLVGWSGHAVRTSGGPLQFHLRHLLLLMVFVSLAFAPARFVLPPSSVGEFRLEAEMLVGVVVLSACSLPVTVPCIRGAMATAEMLGVFGLVWPVVCAAVSGLEITLLAAISRAPETTPSMFPFIYLLNVSPCATIFATLLVFRGLGVRLVKLSAAAAKDRAPRAPPAAG